MHIAYRSVDNPIPRLKYDAHCSIDGRFRVFRRLGPLSQTRNLHEPATSGRVSFKRRRVSAPKQFALFAFSGKTQTRNRSEPPPPPPHTHTLTHKQSQASEGKTSGKRLPRPDWVVKIHTTQPQPQPHRLPRIELGKRNKPPPPVQFRFSLVACSVRSARRFAYAKGARRGDAARSCRFLSLSFHLPSVFLVTHIFHSIRFGRSARARTWNGAWGRRLLWCGNQNEILMAYLRPCSERKGNGDCEKNRDLPAQRLLHDSSIAIDESRRNRERKAVREREGKREREMLATSGNLIQKKETRK